MTTEKAIEFGKIFIKSIEDEKGSATYEFVETAVKTLEEQSTKRIEYGTDGNAYKMSISNGKEFESCDDCISRQAVLDVIEREEFKGDAISEIEKLSSVIPQPKIIPIAEIRFDDDELHKIVEEAINNIENEPKTGHWIKVSDGYGDNAYICECSECKDTVWVYKDADRKWNYCPNCGAKMESEE